MTSFPARVEWYILSLGSSTQRAVGSLSIMNLISARLTVGFTLLVRLIAHPGQSDFYRVLVPSGESQGADAPVILWLLSGSAILVRYPDPDLCAAPHSGRGPRHPPYRLRSAGYIAGNGDLPFGAMRVLGGALRQRKSTACAVFSWSCARQRQAVEEMGFQLADAVSNPLRTHHRDR